MRTWEKFASWFFLAYPDEEKPDLRHLEEYLEECFDEPCARTVPKSILAAVDFIESRGGVPLSERFSKNLDLVTKVQDMTMHLSVAAPQMKKAMMPFS